MTDAAAALEIAGLRKSYGATHVLKGIDVEMGAGEFLVLVGPSGCGKSTLLNCIAGLDEITSGSLRIAGREVSDVPPAERDIAMVFQSYALYPTMSVAENIAFGMRVRGVPSAERRRRAEEVARLLQIEPLLDRRPSQLSGGQRQRVAMGRALVREPALFLFDEPLSNLDAKLRVEMRAEIKRLHERTGASIVYVTHDQVEAMTLATRIVVLRAGEVQQIATPEEIYDRPANTFVADFMGSPPMNLIPARAAGGMVRLGQVEIALDGVRDGPLTVGLRPEHFEIADGRPDLTATPTLIESTGPDSYVTFPLGEGHATARLPGRVPSGPVPLRLRTDRLSLFAEDGARLAPARRTAA